MQAGSKLLFDQDEISRDFTVVFCARIVANSYKYGKK